MVTVRGLFRTIKTTRNFWAPFSWISSKGKVKIVFRNGFVAELDLREYRLVSDILSKGYTIGSLGKLFCFKKGTVRIAGPISLLSVLCEGLDKIYSVDCKEKTVLDIGGFIGESAVFFSAAGAAKVIIYEPIVAHHEFIKINMALNGVNAELHEEGIGENDGYILINYDKIDTCFGLSDKGTNKMLVKIKNIRGILEESEASIAKFDCEGAESSLVSVPPEILQTVDLYIIEIHSTKLKITLLNKFRDSGFTIVKDIHTDSNDNVSTVYLRRNKEGLRAPKG